jgi:hypothetical protein
LLFDGTSLTYDLSGQMLQHTQCSRSLFVFDGKFQVKDYIVDRETAACHHMYCSCYAYQPMLCSSSGCKRVLGQRLSVPKKAVKVVRAIMDQLLLHLCAKSLGLVWQGFQA